MRNKKAAFLGFSELKYIFHILLIIIIFIIVMALIKRFQDDKIETFDLEMEIMKNRIIYSPTCLAYNDMSTGKTYPGIIDINNFKTERQLRLVNQFDCSVFKPDAAVVFALI